MLRFSRSVTIRHYQTELKWRRCRSHLIISRVCM